MYVDFFGVFSIDVLYIILAMLGITIIAIVLSIVCLCKLSNVKKKYNQFMLGKDASSLENLIKTRLNEVEKLKESDARNTRQIKDIIEKLQFAYQKVGIVKYDAFHEMGGKLSFSLCMLDRRNNGYIINSMHSREGCYTYIKEIVKGESYIELGEEEKKALNQALAGRGDVDLGKINEEINK